MTGRAIYRAIYRATYEVENCTNGTEAPLVGLYARHEGGFGYSRFAPRVDL
ncbi:hypothetical protein NXS13_03440 [Corynebacterium sp. ES2730-CONJ]|uniref:hypothetical protein n=1 Tax=Corynebacterium sp. ES2730-CONJ TaxID=2973941 RepID=UPI00216B1191|nr:hypothetical protein [Corynebacterium sp. ES2730-CONJ]MCS4531563.1 hypothetical protein [Corynebacterium sp. ES2730-CONJ]